MNDKYVVQEQVYRDIETRQIAQTRQEMSDGSIEWERPDGSVWDGPYHHNPTCLKPARQKSASLRRSNQATKLT